MDRKWIAAIAAALILIVAAVGAYVYISGDDDSDDKSGFHTAGNVLKFHINGEIKHTNGEVIVTYEGTITVIYTNEIEGNKQTAIMICEHKFSDGTIDQINTKSFDVNVGYAFSETEVINTPYYGEKELYVDKFNDKDVGEGKFYYDDKCVVYKQIVTRTLADYTESYTADLMEYHIAEESECAVFYMGNGSTEYGLYDLVADGTEVTVPDCSFTYENHSFKGWNTSADGKGTSYAAGSTFEAAGESVTLYAQWEESK